MSLFYRVWSMHTEVVDAVTARECVLEGILLLYVVQEKVTSKEVILSTTVVLL